jgi:hypothetical protein
MSFFFFCLDSSSALNYVLPMLHLSQPGAPPQVDPGLHALNPLVLATSMT